MKIQILGPGCRNCELLAEETRKAADALGIDYELEKVQDFDSIMAFGVMATPALVIDGEVKVAGSVPPLAKLKELLS